jgi:hypothetical protein
VASGVRFDLGVDGRLTREAGTDRSAELRLPLTGRHRIEKVFRSGVGGDLLIVYEVGDDESGAGAIVRVSLDPLLLKWHLAVPGFNVSLGRIEDGRLYQAAIGFVSAVDLKMGVFVWKHEGLYDRERSSFNSFERPEAGAIDILFRESLPGNPAGVARTIRVEKHTGFLRSEQSPMEVLINEFSAAAPSKDDQVVGAWILVLNVNTENFLTGRSGADSVLADPSGVRDANLGNRPYWELVVDRGPDGSLLGRSRTTWTADEVSPITRGQDGDLRFTKDYGGDTGYRYRCRAVGADRLVCLFDRPNTGHGVAFSRMK